MPHPVRPLCEAQFAEVERPGTQTKNESGGNQRVVGEEQGRPTQPREATSAVAIPSDKAVDEHLAAPQARLVVPPLHRQRLVRIDQQSGPTAVDSMARHLGQEMRPSVRQVTTTVVAPRQVARHDASAEEAGWPNRSLRRSCLHLAQPYSREADEVAGDGR
jgi:hypothetical protein